jgi:hypothetical protein
MYSSFKNTVQDAATEIGQRTSCGHKRNRLSKSRGSSVISGRHVSCGNSASFFLATMSSNSSPSLDSPRPSVAPAGILDQTFPDRTENKEPARRRSSRFPTAQPSRDGQGEARSVADDDEDGGSDRRAVAPGRRKGKSVRRWPCRRSNYSSSDSPLSTAPAPPGAPRLPAKQR